MPRRADPKCIACAQLSAEKASPDHGADVLEDEFKSEDARRGSFGHAIRLPDEFSSFPPLFSTLFPFDLTEATRALPGEWQEISERIQVLEGDWRGYGPRTRERMTFQWMDSDTVY